MQLCRSSKLILPLAFSIVGIFSTATAFGQAHGPASDDAALSVKKFEAAPGLKVDLFAAEPTLQNPVAFSIDEKGRFFIAETHRYKDAIFDITQKSAWLTNDLGFRSVPEREAFLRKTFGTNVVSLTQDSELIRLVEDRDGDGRAETSSIFADDFNEITSGTAAGILARKNEVWFTCIPDLWKFAEAKGKAVKREKMSTGYGVRISVSGHDLHGLALGPDNKIYFSCGDRGFTVTNREGKVFEYPETGGVLRCNRDGSNLEVFCIGLRNPQELAFDQYGNLFTDDNDTAGPDDSRVVYLVEGADYGWRAPYQYMEGYGPWVRENFWKGNIDDLLPYSGVVAHGPSGLAYYPGTGLPQKYQNHFLACDFPQGVKSFAVRSKGASYEVYDVENFLKRLGSTDVAFGPDSSVYVSDWGLAYTMPNAGRIYRVFDPAQTNSASVNEVKKLLADGMEKKATEELVLLLGHPDMRVRLEAQFAIATNLSAQKAAISSSNQLTRIHAIWSLVNGEQFQPKRLLPASGNSESTNEFAFSLVTTALADLDAEVRAQAAKAYGEAAFTNRAYESLQPLLKDNSPRVRFFATLSLGKLHAKEAVRDIVEMVRENADKDPFLVHAAVSALVNLNDDAEMTFLLADDSISVRHVALLCLRRMNDNQISQLLDDQSPRLVVEAARAINDANITNALPSLAEMIKKPFLTDFKFFENIPGVTNAQEQFIRRVINANFRLGEDENALALAQLANADRIPETLRIEALEALANWEHPSPQDRIVGMWRPLPTRSKDGAETAVRGAITELFQSDSEKVLQATIHALRSLQMNDTTILIVDYFTDTNHSTALRLEALGALVDLKHEALEEVIKAGLADENVAIRREAIKYIEHVSPAATVKILEKLFATEKDTRISQTILITLGKLKDSSADEAIVRLLDQLLDGKIQPEPQLDLIEAAERRSSAAIKEKLQAVERKLAKSDRLGVYVLALVGGDAAAGKKIFEEREDVGCLRCHSIHHIGGTVGPDLGGIGKRQSREYLLESIITPNKQIAAGFESVVVQMKNGNSYAGVVKNESDTELSLDSPEDGQIKVKKSDIEKRTRSLSAMPEEISKLLTKREVRDVVEFLSTVK